MTEQALQTLLIILREYGFPTLVAVAFFIALWKGIGAIFGYFKEQIKLAHEERVMFLATMNKHAEVMEAQNTLLGTMSATLALLNPVKDSTDKIVDVKSQNETIKQNLENLTRLVEAIKVQRARRSVK